MDPPSMSSSWAAESTAPSPLRPSPPGAQRWACSSATTSARPPPRSPRTWSGAGSSTSKPARLASSASSASLATSSCGPSPPPSARSGFYTSHSRDFRHSRWTLLLGSWLYWTLGGCFTRPPRALSRGTMALEEPVISLEGQDGGFEYSDAFLPDGDARFVWRFVRSALDKGCLAANYLEAVASQRDGDTWITRARDKVSGSELSIRSRLLVNACGPYADGVNTRDGISTTHRHVLSKGIHLIVDRLTQSPRVLTFFADDGRLFFAIPMGTKTCIGTTDTPVLRPDVGVTPEDCRFVLDNINKRLKLPRPLEERDIIAERCGVRPLAVNGGGGDARDWMQLSRRHVIETDPRTRHITIFGGKLTDCLNVGERLCLEAGRLGNPPPRAQAGLVRRAPFGGQGGVLEAGAPLAPRPPGARRIRTPVVEALAQVRRPGPPHARRHRSGPEGRPSRAPALRGAPLRGRGGGEAGDGRHPRGLSPSKDRDRPRHAKRRAPKRPRAGAGEPDPLRRRRREAGGGVLPEG